MLTRSVSRRTLEQSPADPRLAPSLLIGPWAVTLACMHPVLERIHRRARAAGAVVVLPEAEDPRIVRAATEAARLGLARPILVGRREAVEAAAASAGVPLSLPVRAPGEDPELGAMADELAHSLSLSGKPHRTGAALRAWATDPLVYADLLVRSDRADAAVMGAVATTADTLRAALQVVGVDARYAMVTSCFLMLLPEQPTLVYADCGVIPEPSAEQLAVIAVQAAQAFRRLVGGTPRVALLAFATKGSSDDPSLERVRGAVAKLEAQREAGQIDFAFDGELQVDAALVPAISERKAPGSPLGGRANVLVFPDLNSGNIAYKLTERLASTRAVGPLLLGLKRPVHDLSRGCTWTDALDTIAIAALEAGERRNG